LTALQALPQAAFLVLLEAAAGGTISLFWIHLRGEVGRGFTLFTGACYLAAAVLAIWLRSAFPALVAPGLDPLVRLWLQAERWLTIALVALLAVYLLTLRARRESFTRVVGPLVPLIALAALWSSALAQANTQLFKFGEPLAVLAGAVALGAALTGLSLGHWYLVSPTLSTAPLIRVTFLCLGALAAQIILEPLLLLTAGQAAQPLFADDAIFFGVRVVFGLLVPALATLMTWRTARIRSLDSATGLLYIVSALILAGDISARNLFFLTGVAT
jgi:hypothetical protein